jgi:hypothetical protein
VSAARRPWPVLVAAVLVAALALAGCGGGARPVASPPTPAQPGAPTPAAATPAAADASRTAIARADRTTHELPTPHGPERVDGGWPTPAQAVEGFTARYINWSAATVASRLRALARASIGQARAAVSEQASEVARDGELRRGGIANAGTVEAIGPIAGARDRYAVVTRERTTASSSAAYQGLRPAWHVALATVTRLPDGLWVLSGWQPEN